MPVSIADAESLLAVDVGAVTSRAALFDVVDGSYRFIASGQAPSTASAPFRDISEGVHLAIQQLQGITGRVFLNSDQYLIIPSQDGRGVDSFAATISAGPSVKTVVIGLLDDVSIESIQRLAHSTYARVIETIGLNDPRQADEQLDSILRLRPDLILIAGGTDGGATRSVQGMIELTALACHLLPGHNRPAVLYSGNQSISKEVKIMLHQHVSALAISPNIRPSLEVEDLQPAQQALADLYTQIRCNQMGGVQELNTWANGNALPTAFAFGRIIRFLSEIYDTGKGILGIDLGASATTMAVGFGGMIRYDFVFGM